jgi:hypothetical protein
VYPCNIVKKNLVAKIKVTKDNKKKAPKSTEKEDSLSEAVNNVQLDDDDIEMNKWRLVGYYGTRTAICS